MTPAEYAKLKALFFAALEQPEGERGAFVQSACAGNPELGGRLLALLESSREGDGFLEQPPILTADLGETAGLAEGTRLGPWEIVREIGRGGMGTVYEARRAEGDFLRRTAVKVVRPEIATTFFLRRFHTERRILAGLDHPNIARLFDAGVTSDGQPYVVLELVEGEPLLAHCASQGLGLPERLRLFRRVCDAVEHAHRNLVVHRDLKPGNILVTPDGVPKLLDFGIAKLIEPETGPGAEGTATILHLMTPDYASPEQVAGGRITTATDVYSLGVVLYELLCGHKPHRFGTASSREIALIVADQKPTKPSVRLAQGESSSAGLPPRLARRLRGDLDNIVMMALRKEPERRYASVQRFSDDILRHMEGRPVTARRDTIGYRSGKFVRRHRVAVAAAVIAVAALGAGFVETLHQKRLADVQRLRAERRFNDVRKLAGSFLFEIHDAIQNLPGSTPARALVVRRGLQYLDSLAQESAGDAGLQRELGAAYQKVGEVQGAPDSANLGDTKGALRSFRKALAIREALAAQAPQDAALSVELAITLDSLGDALSQLGDAAGSFDAFKRALRVRERLVAADPKSAAARRALATSDHKIAGDLVDRGQYREALVVWRKELAIFEALLSENPSDRRAQRNVALAEKYTGGTLERLGDYAGALDLYRKAVALDEARSAADPTNASARIDLSYSYGALSVCLENRKDLDGALTAYRKAFDIRQELAGADPRNVTAQAALARAYYRIGQILQLKGEPQSAIGNYEKSAGMEEALSKTDPSNVAVRERIAVVLNHHGGAEADLAAATRTPAGERANHWRAARSLYRRCLGIWEDLRHRGVLRPPRTGELERVAKQIAACDQALERPAR